LDRVNRGRKLLLEADKKEKLKLQETIEHYKKVTQLFILVGLTNLTLIAELERKRGSTDGKGKNNH
jgi:hypothetical protein